MVARRPIIRLQRLAQQRKDVEKNLVSNYGTFVGWLRKQSDPCGLYREFLEASSSVRRALMMKFNKQHRPYPGGAQFICAPTIYQPGAGIGAPLGVKEIYHQQRVD